ncbi:High affinity cAMP-specific 3',5'-cyclic phosphodiesterase 7A [Geranomyces michiganensis]|nr:High affinity cAMP-specific 3',5'-cyclic phosphodiesterase 7A [Geranomyces michiganensis]
MAAPYPPRANRVSEIISTSPRSSSVTQLQQQQQQQPAAAPPQPAAAPAPTSTTTTSPTIPSLNAGAVSGAIPTPAPPRFMLDTTMPAISSSMPSAGLAGGGGGLPPASPIMPSYMHMTTSLPRKALQNLASQNYARDMKGSFPSGSMNSKSSSVGLGTAERGGTHPTGTMPGMIHSPSREINQSSFISSTSNVGSGSGGGGGGGAGGMGGSSGVVSGRPGVAASGKADNSMMILSQAGDLTGVAGPTGFFPTRPNLHPVLLSFDSEEQESEYNLFFLNRHRFVWRRTVYLIFFAATCLYAYVMIRSPADGRNWTRLYSDDAKLAGTGSLDYANCPAGWYCMRCNPDYICNAYHVGADLGFWLSVILLPCIVLITLSYKLKDVVLAQWIHSLTAVFVLCYAAGGVILRYIIVEPMTPVFQPALLCIMFIFVAIMFMRPRFVYAVASISVIVLFFIAGYASHVANDPEYSPSTAKTYIISVLALVISAGVIMFNTYETEVYNRSQFGAAYSLHKTNAKLMNQLKVLQKAYGRKVADLDSPLEKSVMLIRSLMADPVNTPSHLMTLGQIMTLLGSSNLLTPDLENQAGELMDNEQEKWLFSEIQPRRKGSGRPRNTSRRRSITKELAGKIDMPIAEGASHASIRATAQMEDYSPSSNVGNISEMSVAERALSPLVHFSGNAHERGGGGGSGPDPSPLPTMQHRASGSAPDLTSSHDKFPSKHSSLRSISKASAVAKFASLPLLTGTGNAFISDPIFNPSVEAMNLLGRVQEYNWPLFDFRDECGGRPLGTLATHLFRHADLFNAFKIPLDVFRTFIVNIENGYRAELPYHNSTHASDVLHCVNYFVNSNDHLSRAAGDIDLLAIYVSAIIHDFDHPGLNNNFLCRISDSRAILYNDRSVLENYHLSSAWRLLCEPQNNFLCNVSLSDMRGIREQVIDMVLATDLSQHFAVLSQFKNRVSSAQFSPEDSKDDRWLLWKILIKLADVSNPSKDWRVYERWVRMILEEFYMQGDVERARGMEISSFMDRNNPSIPGSQNGFIEYIVSPLFTAYDTWMPIPGIMQDLALNREFWLKRKDLGLTTVFPAVGPRGSVADLASAAHTKSMMGSRTAAGGTPAQQTSHSALPNPPHVFVNVQSALAPLVAAQAPPPPLSARHMSMIPQPAGGSASEVRRDDL